MEKPTLAFLADYLNKNLHDKIAVTVSPQHELTLDVEPQSWLDVCHFLRYDHMALFEQLSDLCAVDYLTYGEAEWEVSAVSGSGFSRARQVNSTDPFDFELSEPEFEAEDPSGKRFAVVIHLLSLVHNFRVRVRTFCKNDAHPTLPSLIGIWNSANWYEREAFDLYGILFEYHPDLRRILTDYGFIGHPFRKDFPLIGQVEMRYDPLEKRVVYEPVSIEARTLVPKVIRENH